MRRLINKIKKLCIHKTIIIKTEMSTVNGIKNIYTYKCKKCGKVKKVIVLDESSSNTKIKCDHDIIVDFKDLEKGKGIKIISACVKCKKVLKVKNILD